MAKKKHVSPAAKKKSSGGKAKPKPASGAPAARRTAARRAKPAKPAKPAKRAAARTVVRKAAGKAPARRAKTAGRVKAAAAPRAAAAVPQKLTARIKREIRQNLLAMRNELSGQIRALKQESLKREDSVNSEEDGTDAFDRQFALSIVSAEQNSLLEIDEALRRLDEGTYGACGSCGGAIETQRLEALPFVQTCITCQAELERASGGRRLSPARRSL